MKLLMISTDKNMFDKGSAVAARQLEYAKKYEEVHIIVFTPRPFSETVLGSNIWVYPTRSSSRWMYVFDALKLAWFIVSKKGITDVTCQDPFETGLVGALVKKRHLVKLELQIHTDISSPYFQKFTFLNRIRMLVSKFTLSKADTIRVVSERIKKYLEQFVDPSKIEVRPIAVNTEKIKNGQIVPAADLHKIYPQFSKIVLMLSRLEPEKNISAALEAFKIALQAMPKSGLVIVGSGSQEKELKNLAQKNGIEKSVIFAGWQDDESSKISYYKTADAFLVTSWFEGYGLTLAEAQAAGTKIISTDVGIAREVGSKIVDWKPSEIARGIIDILNI